MTCLLSEKSDTPKLPKWERVMLAGFTGLEGIGKMDHSELLETELFHLVTLGQLQKLPTQVTVFFFVPELNWRCGGKMTFQNQS